MSPTISSRMSSSVTRPIRPRRTRRPPARNARAGGGRPAAGPTAGAIPARTRAARDSAMMSMPASVAVRACTARNRSLAWRTPTMLSGSPRQSGMRVYGLARTLHHDLLRRLVGVDRDRFGAVGHHLHDGRPRPGRGCSGCDLPALVSTSPCAPTPRRWPRGRHRARKVR